MRRINHKRVKDRSWEISLWRRDRRPVAWITVVEVDVVDSEILIKTYILKVESNNSLMDQMWGGE